VKIVCIGVPGPQGNFVAADHDLVPFDESAARDLAQDAMLLALAPDHAERLIEAARRQELAAAASHQPLPSRRKCKAPAA
jgi:hypothetical protein